MGSRHNRCPQNIIKTSSAGWRSSPFTTPSKRTEATETHLTTCHNVKARFDIGRNTICVARQVFAIAAHPLKIVGSQDIPRHLKQNTNSMTFSIGSATVSARIRPGNFSSYMNIYTSGFLETFFEHSDAVKCITNDTLQSLCQKQWRLYAFNSSCTLMIAHHTKTLWIN